MARKCKECGEEMVYHVGDHYKDTGRGQVLFTEVRKFTCPTGCRSTYFDYRHARPAGTPERIFRLIPAPRKTVNVTDPLLSGGLLVMTILMIAAFMMTTLNLAAKVAAVTLITTLGVWLTNFMSKKDSGDERESR